MDSKGSIKFTTKNSGAKLTLYVKAKSSGATLKVNNSVKFSNIGTSVQTMTITLGNAGTYTIKRGTGESYIFYVIVEDGTTSSQSTTQATTKAPSTTQATTKAPSTTQGTTSSSSQGGDIYVSPS